MQTCKLKVGVGRTDRGSTTWTIKEGWGSQCNVSGKVYSVTDEIYHREGWCVVFKGNGLKKRREIRCKETSSQWA